VRIVVSSDQSCGRDKTARILAHPVAKSMKHPDGFRGICTNLPGGPGGLESDGMGVRREMASRSSRSCAPAPPLATRDFRITTRMSQLCSANPELLQDVLEQEAETYRIMKAMAELRTAFPRIRERAQFCPH
jgi:hypothetical protein